MWSLGKTAALAATARIATTHQDRARMLTARLDLAREIHERVVQRLFGVSLVLGSERELTATSAKRCTEEMKAALATAGGRGAAAAPPILDTGATLREELERLGRHYKELPLEVEWDEGVEVPDELEPLAQSVLAEALRNARKHAGPDERRRAVVAWTGPSRWRCATTA